MHLCVAEGGGRVAYQRDVVAKIHCVLGCGLDAGVGNQADNDHVGDAVLLELHVEKVEHIKIESKKKFQEVRVTLEEAIPRLNPAVGEFLRKGDRERAKAEEEHGPRLSILDRDHGALLEIAGGARNARQYEIGNQLTASKMTRYQLPAALYDPLRVVLYEDSNGRGIFEYDKPSSPFG